MWILIGVTAALLVCDRVLKALARSEKLRYRGKLLQLTHLENPGFFLGKGSRYPRLLRWAPLGIWLLAAALLLPDVERRTAPARLGILLTLTGGLSNQYDRLRRPIPRGGEEAAEPRVESGGLHAAGRHGADGHRAPAGADKGQIRQKAERSSAFLHVYPSLLLIIQAAVAVAFVVGVGDLVLELPAHAAVLLGAGQTAGTVAAGAAQALTDGADDLLIFVETYLHTQFSFALSLLSV